MSSGRSSKRAKSEAVYGQEGGQAIWRRAEPASPSGRQRAEACVGGRRWGKRVNAAAWRSRRRVGRAGCCCLSVGCEQEGGKGTTRGRWGGRVGGRWGRERCKGGGRNAGPGWGSIMPLAKEKAEAEGEHRNKSRAGEDKADQAQDKAHPMRQKPGSNLRLTLATHSPPASPPQQSLQLPRRKRCQTIRPDYRDHSSPTLEPPRRSPPHKQ